jgi:hypothetical protein
MTLAALTLSASRAWGRLAPLAKLAAAAALLGVLGIPSIMPTFITGPAVLLFVFVGPGAAILIWTPDIAGPLRAALVPVLGLGAAIMINYAALLEGFWHPRMLLVLMIAGTLASVIAAERIRDHASAEVS